MRFCAILALAAGLVACAAPKPSPKTEPVPAAEPPAATTPEPSSAEPVPETPSSPIVEEEKPIPAGQLAVALAGDAGKSLNEADREALERAARTAFDIAPANRGVSWRNPATGNTGTITPVKSFQNARRDYCRDFQETITAAGQTLQSHGTACRRPDGTWQVAS